MFHKDMKYGPMLYVKRVQIMENCEELLPQYLRFINGVVESSDLPLNISREILQNNKQIPLMKKNITRKVLDCLSDLQRDEPENYKKFFLEFGKVLKEGLYFDFERKDSIAKLILAESTATEPGVFTTLDDYTTRMKSEQNDIYYITGGSRKELENSPYLEALKEKGYEVLFFTDEFDDVVFTSLMKFNEKQLKSVLKGGLEITEEADAAVIDEFKPLVDFLKGTYGEKVENVKLSVRLKESPMCLITAEGAPDANMERMLLAMGQAVPPTKRTMEINPNHKLIIAMKDALNNDEKKSILVEFADILYAQGILLEGGKIEDIGGYVKKVCSSLMI
jgi:molecular chaperone HtpG